MAKCVLEQYRIADFIQWHEAKQLVLNPDFQRRSVWTPSAKVALIDTILRSLPIPKVYMRTQIDLGTKRPFREVVDGQQRLRAIIEFAQGGFTLTRRAGEFAGLKYSQLPDDTQRDFLSYSIAVDQLMNATDNDVLQVFARLNSYTVNLNAQEIRHGKYTGPFRWAVYYASQDWGEKLWERYKILTKRQRLRMLDDALMAEMFGIILRGVMDGNRASIDRLYSEYDERFINEEECTESVSSTIQYIIDSFGDVLENSALASAPHFLMLFAATAHGLFGIPKGTLTSMPDRPSLPSTELEVVRGNLIQLEQILSSDELPGTMEDFWLASRSSTQGAPSRRKRFPIYCRALYSKPLSL